MDAMDGDVILGTRGKGGKSALARAPVSSLVPPK
jgi:hypothetical protein